MVRGKGADYEKATKAAAVSGGYYPFFYQRFDAATKTWTDEEVGAYVRLLNHQWDQGFVPADSKRKNRIAESLKRTWKTVAAKFPPDPEDPSRLLNPTLEEIRARVEEKSEKARQSALARWSGRNANASANASANAYANGDADSMLPNPNPKKEREDARAQGARWSIDRFKLPANMNGRCRAKLQEWLDDRKLHRRPAYKTSRWVARAWKNAGEDEDQLVAAVDHSMAQEYTGIYAPGKTPAKPADGESWTDDLGRLCKRDPFGHLVVVRDA